MSMLQRGTGQSYNRKTENAKLTSPKKKQKTHQQTQKKNQPNTQTKKKKKKNNKASIGKGWDGKGGGEGELGKNTGLRAEWLVRALSFGKDTGNSLGGTGWKLRIDA